MLDDLEVVKAACCIAGLDGEISDREGPVLRKLADRAGIGQASLDAMIDRAKHDRNYYEHQLKFLSGDPDGVIKTLFQVAIADRELHTSERVILRYLADKVGITPERFEQILQAAERRLAD